MNGPYEGPTSGPPRLGPPVDLDDEVRADLEKTRVGGGPVPLVFETLAHHPRLMRRINALGGVFMRSDHIDARTREIVILRVAWRTGCAYELAQHIPIARRAGLDDAEITAITGTDSDALPVADRVLITLADAIEQDVAVDDGTYASMAARWSTQGVLELLALAGFYRMLAGVLNGLRVPIDAWLLTAPAHGPSGAPPNID